MAPGGRAIFQLVPSVDRYRLLLSTVCLAFLAHAVIFLPLPLVLQAGAALTLSGLLPGLLLVDWLKAGRNLQLPRSEQAFYSVGVGCGIIIIGMLLLAYVTAEIQRWHTFVAFDALLFVLIVIHVLSPSAIEPEPDPFPGPKDSGALASPFPLPSANVERQQWAWAGMLCLALVGGLFRFANLGYSEFQGDEARAMLRAAETIQGYTDALVGHKKGPGEILLPTAIYSLTGRIDETSARLPFALANFTGLFALYLLGCRLFGPLAGWTAAMLLAVDGYFIGFSRIVQYQSIVFLMVTLAILVLHRLVMHTDRLVHMLTLAVLLLATGLLSHYEAALVVFPSLWLLFLLGRKVGFVRLARALLIPAAIGSGLVAIFYVPFVLNPNFAVTASYIAVNRIGVNRDSGGFPYNNLVDVFERTALYSSSYYLLFLIWLTVVAVALVYHRALAHRWRWIAIGVWVAGVLTTFWRPTWGTPSALAEPNDHTWVFFAVAIGFVICLPVVSWQERSVWLWFGGPMLLSLFFIATPNTHVYGFFIGWSLLVGMTVERGWLWLNRIASATTAKIAGLAGCAALILLFGNYAYWYFVHNRVEILRTWQTNRPAGYWVPYTMPTNMSIFGFPFRNGWKAIGVLYADGTLNGAFDTNGRDAVAEWYTRGTAYCPRDHRYYIYSHAVEPAEAERLAQLRAELENHYSLWGTVEVNGQSRLRIYTKSQSQPATPRTLTLDPLAKRFDTHLVDPHFERSGPIGESLAAHVIGHPLDFYMGVPADDPDSAIRLRGFSLKQKSVQPGDEVTLVLYWEARQPTPIPYSVTTQLLDPETLHKIGQRDGEPICNMRPTNHWLTGELFADRYRIPVAADAAPGTYQVWIGLYDRKNGQQLRAFTPEGKAVGNGLGIGQIDVVHDAR